jgi:hypothetical protein
MSYRSLALLAAALSSTHVATAAAQSVYVAPGGVYVGAGPVYVIPALPNGAPPYAVPGPAGAPGVVTPGPANGTGQVFVVPAPASGAPVVVAPGAANGTQVYVVPRPAEGAPLAAYAAGRADAASPLKRAPAYAVRERPSAVPPAYAAKAAPRPPAAVPYAGSSRCVVYGRREYCD